MTKLLFLYVNFLCVRLNTHPYFLLACSSIALAYLNACVNSASVVLTILEIKVQCIY